MVLLAASLPASFVVSAAESAYPSRPVRIIAPFPPGSGVDIIARTVGQALSVAWKHPVVVDNRAGAGGTVGSDIVAKANPDGHTLLLGNVSTLAITPHLYRNLPYDPLRDFAPITLITTSTNVLVIHPSVPARSIKEFVVLAKANPRGFSYGSTGSGTTPHLAGEMFKTMAGVEMVHVPYKGSAPALADLLGGQVQVMFGTLATSTPLIRSGKLRALGVTSLKRADVLPDVPSINEALLPGFEVMIWQAMVAPSRTPKSVVARLNADIVKSLHTPEMRLRLTSQGLEAVGNSPEEFSEYIRAEYTKWGKVVKASGATLD